MSRIVDYPAVLGQRLFPLDCESDKTNVTLQTWSVCLLDSHSFPKRQEKVPLFTYILCQESGISPALRASTNDQEIFWVDEHRGKSRGKKEKRKCGSLKKISPLTTLCLSSPPGHSSRPAQRSPPPVRPPHPSSVPFQSIASLLEYTAYQSNHMFYIKWGLWAFKQSVHQYNAWCTVKLSLWQLLLSVPTVSTDGLLSQLTVLHGFHSQSVSHAASTILSVLLSHQARRFPGPGPVLIHCFNPYRHRHSREVLCMCSVKERKMKRQRRFTRPREESCYSSPSSSSKGSTQDSLCTSEPPSPEWKGLPTAGKRPLYVGWLGFARKSVSLCAHTSLPPSSPGTVHPLFTSADWAARHSQLVLAAANSGTAPEIPP